MLSLRIFEDDLSAWDHGQYSAHAGHCGMLYRSMVIRKRAGDAAVQAEQDLCLAQLMILDHSPPQGPS